MAANTMRMARTTVGMTMKSEAMPPRKRSCHWYCRWAVYTPRLTPTTMEMMVASDISSTEAPMREDISSFTETPVGV